MSGSTIGQLLNRHNWPYSEFRYVMRSDICRSWNCGRANFFWFISSSMCGPCCHKVMSEYALFSLPRLGAPLEGRHGTWRRSSCRLPGSPCR